MVDEREQQAGPARGKKRPPPEGRRTLSYQLRARIDFIRSRDGITAYEVARRAEIDPKVLARFLAGTRGLTMATADRIAEAFGLTLEEGRARKPDAKGRPRARLGS